MVIFYDEKGTSKTVGKFNLIMSENRRKI